MIDFESEEESDEYVDEAVNKIVRGGLPFFEEAELIKEIILRGGFTQTEVADILGRTQGYISNKLRLLRLSEGVRKIIIEENITERHARALVVMKNEDEQIEMIGLIKSKKYTAMETEQIAGEGMSCIEEIDRRKKEREERRKYFYAGDRYSFRRSADYFSFPNEEECMLVSEGTSTEKMEKMIFSSEDVRRTTLENLNVLRKFTKNMKSIIKEAEDAGMIAKVEFKDSSDEISYNVSFPKKDNMLWK